MRRIGVVWILLATAVLAEEDLAARTLKVWDRNGDGVLTADELPDDATFQKADRDRDGKVTREEIAIFLGLVKPPQPKTEKPPKAKGGKKTEKPKAAAPESKSDGGVKKAPFTVSERVKDFFERYDRDKNELVSRKEAAGIAEELFTRFDRSRDDAFNVREATRYVRWAIREAKKRPTRENFFDLWDRNRDRRVTKREYDGPPAFFRAHDHDKDKVVTLQELNMGPNAGMAMDKKQRARDEEFMADGPTKAPKRTLLDRYDANKDGRITLEELNGAEALMQRLDKNRDGVLSGAEAK
ncbi:MAG: hypothetical protein AAGD14_06660 [Planctomycetota bacterium]